MSQRAPFQVLVLPYCRNPAGDIRLWEYFSRSDDSCWRGIAGGGEDRDSVPFIVTLLALAVQRNNR